MKAKRIKTLLPGQAVLIRTARNRWEPGELKTTMLVHGERHISLKYRVRLERQYELGDFAGCRICRTVPHTEIMLIGKEKPR